MQMLAGLAWMEQGGLTVEASMLCNVGQRGSHLLDQWFSNGGLRTPRHSLKKNTLNNN